MIQGYSADARSAGRPRVAFLTMGCAKNEVDTEKMKSRLSEAGYVLDDAVDCADAIVVNTCSFIQDATEESLEVIFEMAGLDRVKAGEAKIVVAGCMPARYGADLESELTEASKFVPCAQESDIVTVIDECLGVDREAFDRFAADVSSVSESRSIERAYSYVKISDGCDRWCSYCTIPLIRGRYHSFPYDDILADVASRVQRGAKEIDLIAQDTGRWGSDFDEPSSLATLMSDLADEFPDVWFRVMYLQPEGVTDDVLFAMRDHDNICSYLDIPLQHVDEGILKAMNRSGSREQFEKLVDHVRTVVPDVTLRTTLIAGFPGETEEMFEELLDFVSEGMFDYVGVFAYSREEGTRAFKLPDQVDDDVKLERAQAIRDAADAASAALISQRIGTQVDVLVEGIEEDGQVFGRARCQAPEVDGVTYLSSGEPGQIVRVEIVDTLMYEMEGE